MLVIAMVVAAVSAVSGCQFLSASDPAFNNSTIYKSESLDVCTSSGQGFPANRLFTLYTRPFDYNPLGTVKCSVVSKHQYYLVDNSTGQRYGDKYYLTNTNYNTPHFPPCIQADGTVHPGFITTCIGRCGAGCGDGEQGAGLQAIGVGYTSSDLGAGADAYKRCHVGCWYHDACIYAKLCPKSVQWVNDQGQMVTAPQAVLDQCNAPTNPSIVKCGALEYAPLRRTCTNDSPNPSWPTKADYLSDCVHGRIAQAAVAAKAKCGDETDSAVCVGIGWMVSVLAFIAYGALN